MKTKVLSIRQTLCVKLLLLAVKIIGPFQYDHQWKEASRDIEEYLNKINHSIEEETTE
jgi:hypothetical protein